MKRFIHSFGFLILLSGLSMGGLKGMEIGQQDENAQSNQHPALIMSTEEDVLEEILNGNFREHFNYFNKLEELKDEMESSTMAYAYQLLGSHYVYEGEASLAAKAYFLSLKNDPSNWELTQYLNKIGVTSANTSPLSIEEALSKIIKR